MKILESYPGKKVVNRVEKAFLKSETLEEFYLKELEKMQSKLRPEIFKINKVKKS